MRLQSTWGLVLVCSSLLLACGGDDSGRSTGPGVGASDGDDGGSEDLCVDKDMDGYSANCHPLDCKDSDPDVTDECTRCKKANDDCPCEVGTPPVACDPPDIVGDGGVFECKEGNRYCRKGRWSACEQAGAYVFVPNN